MADRGTRTGALPVRLAAPSDEAEVRSLLRRTVLDGRIRLAFTREPSYLHGEGLAGSRDLTMVAVHDGRVGAMGRCSVQSLMRNGVPVRVGYLGELRSDNDTPRLPRLLQRGYRMLLEQGTYLGAEGFVTAVADDNLRARRVLEHGGRLGLPRYTPLAPLITLLVPCMRTRAVPNAPPRVSADEQGELTGFLAAQAAHSNLSLAWSSERWHTLLPHDLAAHDACIVRDGARIVGAALVWDQRAFRQTVVAGYDTSLSFARPLLNGLAGLAGLPMLPPPGSVLAQGTLLAAAAESASVWRALLPLVQHRAAQKGLSMVAVTLDRRDPAVQVIRSLVRTRVYHTTMYEVAFDDTARFRDPWDHRLFRPEAGLL